MCVCVCECVCVSVCVCLYHRQAIKTLVNVRAEFGTLRVSTLSRVNYFDCDRLLPLKSLKSLLCV